jgi:hypothetical protein
MTLAGAKSEADERMTGSVGHPQTPAIVRRLWLIMGIGSFAPTLMVLGAVTVVSGLSRSFTPLWWLLPLLVLQCSLGIAVFLGLGGERRAWLGTAVSLPILAGYVWIFGQLPAPALPWAVLAAASLASVAVASVVVDVVIRQLGEKS